jgi:hypothetical protein
MLDIKRGQLFVQPDSGMGDQGIKQTEVVAQVKSREILQGLLAVRFSRPPKPVRLARFLHALLFGFVLTPLKKLHHHQTWQTQWS